MWIFCFHNIVQVRGVCVGGGPSLGYEPAFCLLLEHAVETMIRLVALSSYIYTKLEFDFAPKISTSGKFSRSKYVE